MFSTSKSVNFDILKQHLKPLVIPLLEKKKQRQRCFDKLNLFLTKKIHICRNFINEN